MTREAYVAEWEDDPASWPQIIHQSEFDWLTVDVVYVAEYFVVEEKKETIHIYQPLVGEEERYSDDDLDDDGALLKRLEATGAKEVRTKKRKVKRIRKYVMSGGVILEDCGYIAGKCIPVIPVYGKRWFIDNLERCCGHVRLAKDAQRIKNMLTSKLAEISALSSVSKPIFTPEQIAGHQLMWSEDNLKNYPYLLVNPIVGPDGMQQVGGPLAYTKSPEIPPALAGLLQVSENDIKDVLGNPQDGDKIVSNISGKAVEMVQQRLDAQTFVYIDNFKKAMRRCGEVWLSMAKEVYVEDGRKMKAISYDGQASTVELARPAVTDDGVVHKENDLSAADFDVVVDVGPSTISKKAATVRALTGMLALVPPEDTETRSVLTAATLMNMEGEGLSDIRDWFRGKMLRLGVVKPTEEEAKKLQAEQQAAQGKPDPQAEALLGMAEEAKAKAAGARATTVKTIADSERIRAETEKLKAETIEVVANLDMGTEAHAMKVLSELHGMKQPPR